MAFLASLLASLASLTAVISLAVAVQGDSGPMASPEAAVTSPKADASRTLSLNGSRPFLK